MKLGFKSRLAELEAKASRKTSGCVLIYRDGRSVSAPSFAAAFDAALRARETGLVSVGGNISPKLSHIFEQLIHNSDTEKGQLP